jgi:arginase
VTGRTGGRAGIGGVPTLISPFHLDEPLADLPTDGRRLDVVVSDGPMPQRLIGPYRQVAAAVADAVGPPTGRPVTDPLVVVSGDCNTSLGTLTGLQRAGVDPSIVWFDAHGDFHTAATTTSGYLGGLALAMLVGDDDLGLADAVGLTPIAADRVVLVDARDLDPAERERLDASAVTRLPVGELTDATLPPGPIYLHLDVDVIDAAACPDLRFPAGGGPSPTGVAAAVRRALDSGRVVAVGLACTWTEEGLTTQDTAELVARLGFAGPLRTGR